MSLLGLLILSLLSPVVSAQLSTEESVRWQEAYGNFASNQAVIEIPFTAKNAKKLKQRLQLYRLRIMYLPVNGFDNGAVPILKIAFFKNKNDAREILEASNFLFDGQKIKNVSAGEHGDVMTALLKGNKPGGRFFVYPVTKTTKNPFTELSDVLLDEAKNLYMDKKYEQAVNHYQLIALIADDNSAAWATELLGLSYEKLGKRDQAIATYQQLLDNYPENSGVERVEQRLRGLQTAANDEQDALRKSKYEKHRRFFVRGVFGQFYRTLNRSTNQQESEQVLSLVTSDFDFRASGQYDEHSVRARTNGYWLKDELRPEESEFRLKQAYVDYNHADTGISGTIGRQKDYDNGVYTSYDGIKLTYPIRKNLRASVSTGKPVYFSDFYEDKNYFFYSGVLQWDITQQWLLNTYFVKQTLGDVTDRQAVGMRTLFNTKRLSTSLFVDYDTAFAELNNILWNGNVNVTRKLNVTAMAGQQRSPFLTATNIYIGQADLDLELYLRTQQNRDRLLDDALARTSLNTYYSLSINNEFTDDTRLYLDYYHSTLSDIPTAQTLANMPEPDDAESPTFTQDSYGARFIMDNVFYKTDSFSVGVRRNLGSTSESTQIYMNERLRIGRKFMFMPYISYAYVVFADEADNQQQLRYSATLSYKPFRNTELRVEAGNEAITVEQNQTQLDSSFIFVGYRVNF